MVALVCSHRNHEARYDHRDSRRNNNRTQRFGDRVSDRTKDEAKNGDPYDTYDPKYDSGPDGAKHR